MPRSSNLSYNLHTYAYSEVSAAILSTILDLYVILVFSNTFLAVQNIGVDSKIIKFELIVTCSHSKVSAAKSWMPYLIYDVT